MRVPDCLTFALTSKLVLPCCYRAGCKGKSMTHLPGSNLVAQQLKADPFWAQISNERVNSSYDSCFSQCPNMQETVK